MRKIFWGTVVLVFLLAFTGCNSIGVKETEITEGYVDAADTKSKTFMGESLNPSRHPVRVVCSIESLSGIEEEKVTMEIGMIGSDYYVETDTPEAGHTSIIVKGDKVYSVMHDTKSALMTSKTEDMEGMNPLMFMTDFDKIDLGGGDIQTGAEELNGKTYEYEEFIVEDKTVRMLFEKTKCRAIRISEDGITETMTIDEYDANVNKDKLEVPSDYQLINADELQ